jgi:hypothetical protein
LLIFRQYSRLLKREFISGFKDIMANEDFGPMQIQTLEEYENVVNVSWFKDPSPSRE